MTSEDEERAFRTYLKFWLRFLDGDAREWLRWLSWKAYPVALSEHSGAAVGYSPSRHGIWLRTDEKNRRNVAEHLGVKEDALPVDLPSQFLPRGRLYGVMARVVQVQLAVCRADTVVGGALRQGSFPEGLRDTAGSDVPRVFLGFTVIPQHVKSSTPGVRWIRLTASEEEARRFVALKSGLASPPAGRARLGAERPMTEESHADVEGTGPGGHGRRRRRLFPGVEDVVEETRLPREIIVERFRELETRDPPAGFVLKIVVAALGSNLRSCPVELVRHSYETWYEDRPQPARRGEGSAALDRLERDEWVRRNSGEVYSRHLEFPKDVGWRTTVSVDDAVMKALSGELALGYGDTWFFDQWMQWVVGRASGLPRRVARRVLTRGIMVYLKHPDRRATVLRALASIASSRAAAVPWWAELLIDAGDPGNGLAMLERYAKRRKNVEPRVWCHMLRASTTLGQHETALEVLRRLSEEARRASTSDDDETLRLVGWCLLKIGIRAPGDGTLVSVLRIFGRTEPLDSVERLATVVAECLEGEDVVRPHLIEGLRDRDDIDEEARASLIARSTPTAVMRDV